MVTGGKQGTEQDNKGRRRVMSLFSTITKLQFHVRERKLCSSCLMQAHRGQAFGRSSGGINHIQAFASTFFLAKNEREVVSPFLGYSAVLFVKESDRVGINKPEW